MFRLFIAVVMIVAGGIQIQAQDALRSALSLDPALASRQNPELNPRPDQPHLGPVELSVAAYAGVAFDDNVNESEHAPEGDIISQAGVRLGLRWPATDQSELRFSARIGYLQYSPHSQNSGLEISPDSALIYSVAFTGGSLSFFDQFNYWREVSTEGSLANVATLPRLDNTIGARVSWEPSRWVGQFGYSHENFLSDNAANSYLDRASEYLFARAGWRLAEKSEMGVEASGSFTSYRLHIQNDNQSVSVGPYADWQVRPSLHIMLRGGPTLYFFGASQRSAGSSDLNSYYADLELSHQLTDFLSHQLTVRRDVQPGLNQGSDYVEQLTLNYALSYALTQRINVSAIVIYENGDQPLPVLVLGPFIFEAKEQFVRYGAGPQVSWRFTDKLTGSLSYFHWQRESNLPGRTYSENTVSLSLNYTF